MAKTLPSEWEYIRSQEITPGLPVAEGYARDLRRLVRSQNRNAGYNTRILAVVSKPPGIETIGASYEELARGVFGAWSKTHNSSVILRAEGRNCIVRLTVEGVALGTVTLSSTSQWYSSTALGLSGVTIPADGIVEFLLEVVQTGSSPHELFNVTVEEREISSAGNLPDGDSDSRGLACLYDDAVDRDNPYDAWIAQRLEKNQRALDRVRARGICHSYPRGALGVTPERHHQLSSVHWRCDGPYLYYAQPWVDQVRVATLVKALPLHTDSGVDLIPGNDVEFFAFSALETWNSLLKTRAVTVTPSSVTKHVFEDIPVVPGQLNAIWIAYKSETLAAQVSLGTSDVTGPVDFGYPEMLYCDATFEPWVYIPTALAGSLGTDRTLTDYTGGPTGNGEAVADYDPPEELFDIAMVRGALVGGGSDTDMQIGISPPPWTGITTNLHSQVVGSYQPTISPFTKGVLNLYGVYIEGDNPEPTSYRAVQEIADLARSRALSDRGGGLIRRINEHTTWGVPMIMTRHHSQRHLRGAVIGGLPLLGQRTYDGDWLMIGADKGDPLTVELDVPLPFDPNHGAASGPASDTLYAQVWWMAVKLKGGDSQDDWTAKFGLQWVVDGVEQLEVDTEGPAISANHRGDMAITHAEAVAASDSISRNGVSDANMVQYTWTQNGTWPTETGQGSSVWQESAIAEGVFPAAFPHTATLKITAKGMTSVDDTAACLVIGGVAAWFGQRL